MKKLFDCVNYEIGTPQFRIQEEISMDSNVPTYIFYGQQEMESDLRGIVQKNTEAKTIRTRDKVSIIEEGDIIFSLISGKATIAKAAHQGYLLTQNFVKLIPNKKIDSAYLVYLLNENKMIKKQFASGMQGSIVLKYTVTQLRGLELPKLPSLEKQKLLGELYFSQLRYEALIHRKTLAQRTLIFKKMEEVI